MRKGAQLPAEPPCVRFRTASATSLIRLTHSCVRQTHSSVSVCACVCARVCVWKGMQGCRRLWLGARARARERDVACVSHSGILPFESLHDEISLRRLDLKLPREQRAAVHSQHNSRRCPHQRRCALRALAALKVLRERQREREVRGSRTRL